MTPEQFWFDDMRLFRVYEKAYYKGLYNRAFVQAVHFDYALQVELYNFLCKKKGEQPKEFLNKPFDPFERKDKVKSKEDIEALYRKQMMQWI